MLKDPEFVMENSARLNLDEGSQVRRLDQMSSTLIERSETDRVSNNNVP
jgi:hypothetical protein